MRRCLEDASKWLRKMTCWSARGIGPRPAEESFRSKSRESKGSLGRLLRPAALLKSLLGRGVPRLAQHLQLAGWAVDGDSEMTFQRQEPKVISAGHWDPDEVAETAAEMELVRSAQQGWTCHGPHGTHFTFSEPRPKGDSEMLEGMSPGQRWNKLVLT